MRTLRMAPVGMVVLVLLISGLGTAVIAQDETTALPEPVIVTGAQTSEVVQSFGTTVEKDGVYNTERPWWVVTWEADDPRLSGDGTWVANWNWLLEDGPGTSTAAYVLVNPGGRWVGTSQGYGDGSVDNEMVVLHGEGDYDGLTAMLLLRTVEGEAGFQGVIFPFESPEIPDPIEPPAD